MWKGTDLLPAVSIKSSQNVSIKNYYHFICLSYFPTFRKCKYSPQTSQPVLRPLRSHNFLGNNAILINRLASSRFSIKNTFPENCSHLSALASYCDLITDRQNTKRYHKGHIRNCPSSKSNNRDIVDHEAVWDISTWHLALCL